jgi:hypothetical protein
MISQSETTGLSRAGGSALARDRLFQDGLVAGVIGAATIAVWFLVIDVVRGRPLYTPAILGTALFRPAELAASPDAVPVSIEMVLVYTWVHGLVFCVLGGVASWLLSKADTNPNLGFGVLLLFVVFEFGFLVVAMLFAEPVLQALTWPAVLLGNLLAAAAMGVYFWRRHPALTIWP